MKCKSNLLIIQCFLSVALLMTSFSLYGQQTRQITGVVRDSEGPLPGVTIREKGTNNGTATNMDGQYTIRIADNNAAVLVFSYIGYEEQEVTVAGNRTVSVVLKEASRQLEEVVVVAFGVQKKETVVGAISQVKGDELVRSGTGNVSQTLVGRVPGMTSMAQTGMPGDADPQLFIRGLASPIGNNQPLVMVDGIERSLTQIDPSEVESISILKDASATSVYGVKGGNGVVLITTKRGQEGRMQVSVSFDGTLKQSLTKSNQENSYTTLAHRNILFRNEQNWSRIMDDSVLERYRTRQGPWDEYLYPDNDHWAINTKEFAWDYRASVSARGGTKFAKYYLMLGFNSESDIYKTVQDQYDAGFYFQRINFRMNYDFNFTKSTVFSINASGLISHRDMPSFTPQQIFREFFTTPPHTPYYYPAEFVAAFPDYRHPEITGDRTSIDPYFRGFYSGYQLLNQLGQNRIYQDRLTSDIMLNQKLDFITPGLSFLAKFSYNNFAQYRNNYWGYTPEAWLFEFSDPDGKDYTWTRYYNLAVNDYSTVSPPFRRPASVYGTNWYDYVYSGLLNYSHAFGNHSLSALARFERRFQQIQANFPTYEENWAGRASYDYDNKYMLEASIGIAGSARFAPSNRFGYFPALAFGWNIAREKFFTNIMPKEISTLKARYTWGITGFDNVAGYLYISEYTNVSPSTNSPSHYFWGGFGETTTFQQPLVREGSVPNINAQWERATKQNLAFDLGLFNNTLNFSVDFFDEQRDRILMTRRAVSYMFGQSMREQNLGKTKRHGMELEASYFGGQGDWTWFASANYSFNENRIVNWDSPLGTLDYMRDEGKPINWLRQPVGLGYYENMDQWMNYSLGTTANRSYGWEMVLDYDANGIYSGDDNVPTSYNTRPSTNYGWSGGLTYKQFEFNFMFQGVTNMWRNWSSYGTPMIMLNNDERYVLWKGYKDDLWSPTNPDARWGALKDEDWPTGGKGWRSGNYLRLKNMEIAYRFEKAMLKKIGIRSARIALQGYNVWTWVPEPYKFGDPENEPSGRDSFGNMFQLYPIPRRFTCALRFDF